MLHIAKGDQFTKTLPSWIDNGRTVVVTTTKVFKKWGKESFNGHDIEGTWKHSNGSTRRGKFYLKDLTPIKTPAE